MFFRKLRSFTMCCRLLCMLQKFVVASVDLFGVGRGNIKVRDAGRFNKLVERASSFEGWSLDTGGGAGGKDKGSNHG